MRLSTQTSCLERRLGYEKAIDTFKEAGFECIDWTLSDVGSPDDPFSADDYKSLAASIKAYADRAGIEINQTHSAFHQKWELMPLDGTMTDSQIFKNIVRSIEISALLGAPISVIHPLHHMVYEGHADEIRELNYRYFRALIPYCKEYGVKLAIENMFQRDEKRRFIVPDTCSSVEEHIRYVDELDSEHITACLDVGHVGLVYGQEATDSIRRLGADRLTSLHMCDNDYTNDQHMLCGMGKIKWAEVMDALEEIGYRGDFTYECDGGFLWKFPRYMLPAAVKFMYEVGMTLVDGKYKA